MDNKSYVAAWNFLQSASSFDDLEQMQDAFSLAIKPFGFDRFSCSLVFQADGPPSPRVLFGRSNRSWDEYYLAQGYLRLDPCIRRIFTRPGPFAWSDVGNSGLGKEAKEVMDAAAEADAREGFVVPVLSGNGDLYGVRMSSPQKEFDPAARPTLHALATVYAFEGVKLLELIDDVATRTPLSRRETECLRWVSEGKSDWDIGEILSISEATVHTHIENAKRKIGVRSRIQAAVLAAIRGWLVQLP